MQIRVYNGKGNSVSFDRLFLEGLPDKTSRYFYCGVLMVMKSPEFTYVNEKYYNGSSPGAKDFMREVVGVRTHIDLRTLVLSGNVVPIEMREFGVKGWDYDFILEGADENSENQDSDN